MRHFTIYSLLALLVTLDPASVLAAPIGTSSGSTLDSLTSLVPTSGSGLMSTGSSPAGSASHLTTTGTSAGTGTSGSRAKSASDPNASVNANPTATTATNAAVISGLLNLADDAANIVGNTVKTDTLSNNDGNSILNGNQIANVDVGGEQANGSGNGNENGNGHGHGGY